MTSFLGGPYCDKYLVSAGNIVSTPFDELLGYVQKVLPIIFVSCLHQVDRLAGERVPTEYSVGCQSNTVEVADYRLCWQVSNSENAITSTGYC